jgi:hypothetical protein
LLEANTLPGMTATSLIPQAAAAAGIRSPSCASALRNWPSTPPRRQAPLDDTDQRTAPTRGRPGGDSVGDPSDRDRGRVGVSSS